MELLGLRLPIDEQILTAEAESPLADPLVVGGFEVGNRWCIHPMEGWDALPDGSPSGGRSISLSNLLSGMEP